MSPTLATLCLRSFSFRVYLAMAEITANPLASESAAPHRLWNEAELANLRIDPSRGEGPLISSLKPGCQPHRQSSMWQDGWAALLTVRQLAQS